MDVDCQQEMKYMLVREGPYSDPEKGAPYFVLEHENKLGRGVDATLTILSLYVSRIQCIIYYDPMLSKWYISDYGSLNGTYLNESRLAPDSDCELHLDDRIGLGISWNNYLNSITQDRCEADFFVYRFVHGYPYDGFAVDALCEDISGM